MARGVRRRPDRRGAAAASYRFTVPGGGQVRGAGVTAVGVQPTHRRRGINAALMRAQLDDIHARGEPIAVLWASEGGIYGRFGYGLSAFFGEIDLEGSRTTFIRGYRPTGSVRLLPRDEALPLLRAIYDRAQPSRPGMIAMTDAWWELLFFEKEADKDDPTFFAVHDTDGVPDAYATYRVKHEWPESIPKLEMSVRQLVATKPQAYADIWRFLFDVDLVHRVTAWNRPVDDPLHLLLEEPRRLRFRMSRRVARATRRRAGGSGSACVRGRRPRRRSRWRIAFCPWNEGRYALEVAGGAPAARGRTMRLRSPAAPRIWVRPTWEA